MIYIYYIYINDLEDDISRNVQSLQDDLDKLVKWSEKRQLLFNFGKCKCIHTRHGNIAE